MKIFITSLAVVVFALGGYMYLAADGGGIAPVMGSLTEPQAREIAERSCVKGGEVLGAGVYNAMTKTWWYDANLNATRPGCSPACVVSEETAAAEINWRCTGLIMPVERE